MPEQITKLHPARTIALRGFDSLGASASLHSATDTSFVVSGCFRDPADFAVLYLYDADNFYEHPRLKYLPDFDFSTITLQFDVQYTNLMPLNCSKFSTIDWPYLDVITQGEGHVQIRLADNATVIGGSDLPASTSFTFVDGGLDAYDRVTLWYLNLAFDYTVPGLLRTEYQFYAQGPGTVHSIVIAGRTYTYTEVAGDGSADVATHLANLVNGLEGGGPADPDAQALPGSVPFAVLLQSLKDDGTSFEVSASDTNLPALLWNVKLSTVVASIANQINTTNWTAVQAPFSLQTVVQGSTIQITTTEGGYDANFLTMYAVAKNTRLTTAAPVGQFQGGTSNSTFRVTLNFAALNVPSIRQMWLTFAPMLAFGKDYVMAEWEANFTNWTVTGSSALKVAGPNSVRVTSQDPRCAYTGTWVPQEGFFANGLAFGSNAMNDAVTIRYYCAYPHDLWLGTSLYSDRGLVNMTLDGNSLGPFSALLEVEPAIQTRRQIATGVAPGDHTVTLTAANANAFYFDFLEAAVPDDVPDALPAKPQVTAALDYSTDHTYKLPPARILWILQKLGLTGPMNQYLGVFWWNERQSVGDQPAQASITFTGPFQDQDGIFIQIGDVTCGKTVFPYDTNDIIAQHFVYEINATYVGVWAEAQGNVLTIHARSSSSAYQFKLQAWLERSGQPNTNLTVSGSLLSSVVGSWDVNPAETPVLNVGAREWHKDFYTQCSALGFVPTTSVSMELVNPPTGFPATFPDGSPVITDTGFGGLRSTHCAFSSAMAAYQQAVFLELAALMANAGLTPSLQMGEFTWWYFSSPSGMAYYDAETAAAAQTALGRPLAVFHSPTDDPTINGSADALFLRNRLRDYAATLAAAVKAAYPNAQFEILFPYDVNHPTPAGVNQLGGPLNFFINLPVEWQAQTTSPFTTFKIESLDFSAWSRDLDLAKGSLDFAAGLSWPRASLRAMVPVFRGGYPWHKELRYALDLGYGSVSLWAFDHICLYGIRLMPRTGSIAQKGGA